MFTNKHAGNERPCAQYFGQFSMTQLARVDWRWRSLEDFSPHGSFPGDRLAHDGEADALRARVRCSPPPKSSWCRELRHLRSEGMRQYWGCRWVASPEKRTIGATEGDGLTETFQLRVVSLILRNTRVRAMANRVYLVASGDLRPSANQMCWPAQKAMEEALETSVRQFGWEICRAPPVPTHQGARFHR